MHEKHYNAVVLAGDRGSNDPVLMQAKVPSKAEISFAGLMQLERVLIALSNADYIDKIFVVGPNKKQATSRLHQVIAEYQAIPVPIAEGPSASAMQGLNYSPHFPALVVTCDLPLLKAEHINAYCRQISAVTADFIIGTVSYASIADAFPEMKKTIYKFTEGSVCFANIFAVMTDKGMRAVDFWRQMENLRKSPLQIITRMGWKNLLLYKLGRLSLDEVARILSNRVMAQVEIEDVLIPALSVDIDSVHDYEVMSRYLKSS